MKNFKTLKKELLRDDATKKAYDDLELEFQLIAMLIRKRLQKGLTQEKLAQSVGTQQSAIARFESGAYNPTISFLKKISRALGAELRISVT